MMSSADRTRPQATATAIRLNSFGGVVRDDEKPQSTCSKVGLEFASMVATPFTSFGIGCFLTFASFQYPSIAPHLEKFQAANDASKNFVGNTLNVLSGLSFSAAFRGWSTAASQITTRCKKYAIKGFAFAVGVGSATGIDQLLKPFYPEILDPFCRIGVTTVTGQVVTKTVEEGLTRLLNVNMSSVRNCCSRLFGGRRTRHAADMNMEMRQPLADNEAAGIPASASMRIGGSSD